MEAVKIAIEYQQNYYELLPDWFEYDSTNYECIRHRIGYALFGPTQNDMEASTTSTSSKSSDNQQNVDMFNRITYDKKSCKIIDTIYQKIIQYGKESKDSSLYVGIIFNIIFLSKTLTKSTETSSTSNKEFSEMYALPIFKIKKELNSIWYIDNEGRIYKSWKDYLTNNTLPKCTMVFPKDGVYQCDPNSKVSQYFSAVWVEVLHSPACAARKSIFSVIDVVANTLSVGASIGLGVATFVTPVGPALITTGIVAAGVSGAWSVARNSQKLVDLTRHKQSISPINKNAFPAWLGISGTALTLGASGGTMLLSRAAGAIAQGSAISSATKIACNSVIVGNLTVQGVGMIYEGCCLIDKYKDEKKIDVADITILISHVLFFSNTVINTKLASELIRTWKGTILEKFRYVLRFNRFRKEFTKTVQLNDANGQDKSKGIIYRARNIINKEDFLNNLSMTNCDKKFPMKYEDGKIVVNNIRLLDPMIFIGRLLTIGGTEFNLAQSDSSEKCQDTNGMLTKLKRVIQRLLKEFYSDKSSVEQSLDINNFDDILKEMKHMSNATDILTKIFNVAIIIVSRCNSPEQFLHDIIRFLWIYCKATLKEYNVTSGMKENRGWIRNLLTNIITCIHDYIDTMADDLFAAFYTYASNREKINLSGYKC